MIGRSKFRLRAAALLVAGLAAVPSPAANAPLRRAPFLIADGARPDAGSCICMEVYKPVCATMPDGEKRTFSNACFAKCAKTAATTEGPC